MNIASASATYGQPEIAVYSATSSSSPASHRGTEPNGRIDDIRAVAIWPLGPRPRWLRTTPSPPRPLGVRITLSRSPTRWESVHPPPPRTSCCTALVHRRPQTTVPNAGCSSLTVSLAHHQQVPAELSFVYDVRSTERCCDIVVWSVSGVVASGASLDPETLAPFVASASGIKKNGRDRCTTNKMTGHHHHPTTNKMTGHHYPNNNKTTGHDHQHHHQDDWSRPYFLIPEGVAASLQPTRLGRVREMGSQIS